MRFFDDVGQIAHFTCGAWVLQQSAKHILFCQAIDCADLHFKTQEACAGLHHFDCLRVNIVCHEEDFALALTGTVAQSHRFSSSSRFIQQGRVRDFHAGQVHHHLLVVKQRFQTTL